MSLGYRKETRIKETNLEIPEAACMKNNMGVENLMCIEE